MRQFSLFTECNDAPLILKAEIQFFQTFFVGVVVIVITFIDLTAIVHFSMQTDILSCILWNQILFPILCLPWKQLNQLDAEWR